MMKVYNTPSRSIEDFKPINPPHVGMYSCGPTVYDYQHIGHMRTYVGADVLVRALKAQGYTVKWVMNITDVGHLVSDADSGEDKMEKGAKKFGMSVWDIAKKFEKQFFDSTDALNIQRPTVITKATDYIQNQIELIEILAEKGYTYTIADGVYFDTSKFKDYFTLSRQKEDLLKARARVEVAPGKKHPTDFALWKFSPKHEKRQMEWKSPWGMGFPGWHIECSAMSMRQLGPHFDIHTGGIDHIPIHHTNEIAQSEAATGRKFVNYWVHFNHLLIDGQKMSKSLGNLYTVNDIVKKGFHPLAIRYLFLQTHYRQEMNFTFESLKAAQNAFNRLLQEIATWDEPGSLGTEFEGKFFDAVQNDMNMPEALSAVWELVKSDNPTSAKAKSLFQCDIVLGLKLQEAKRALGHDQSNQAGIPEDVQKLVSERERFRKEKRFHLADQWRNKIKKLGYEVLDEDGKTVIKKI